MTATPTEEVTTEHITVEEHERRMAEYRATVRTEAMEMARANDLCTVVEATLKKVGIDSQNRFVTVVTTSELKRVLKVPADLIYGLNEEALAKVVGQYVNGGLPNPVAWRSVEQIALTTTNVGDPVVVVAEELEGVYEQRFTSTGGRVKHMVKVLEGTALENSALCGASTERWNRWPNWSSRDEHRVCGKCETRYAKGMTTT